MATYEEIFGLADEMFMINKVAVAVIIAAENIVNESVPPPNQTERLAWASRALNNPRQEAERMWWAVLASNAAETVATITGASDAQILTNVEAHVDLFADTA